MHTYEKKLCDEERKNKIENKKEMNRNPINEALELLSWMREDIEEVKELYKKMNKDTKESEWKRIISLLKKAETEVTEKLKHVRRIEWEYDIEKIKNKNADE